MQQLRIIPILLLILFSGCSAFEYHQYDGHINGEKNINAKNIPLIEEATKDKDVIRFVWMGDTQRRYDETKKFVRDINARDDIDFVLHGGDISNFGMTREFEWVRDKMNELNVPYLMMLGNHDCIANGLDVFRAMFGSENYTFMAGNVKFVCLNTNALEFGYSEDVPNFRYMRGVLNETTEGHERTVVAMHARPTSEQFDDDGQMFLFQTLVKQYPDLQFCLNAHDHRLQIKDIFDDGVIYYGTPNIGKRSYFIFTITEDNYYYEVMDY